MVSWYAFKMATSTHSRGPLKVLIVEDNRDARTTLRMLLTMGYGHIVYEAGDGLSAIQLAVEHRPDVALIDLAPHSRIAYAQRNSPCGAHRL
jgi:response regulator RpfG family c-di-GMP phosphodiesterase